jgi:FAD/FMN-containing dehydrogenase
VRALSNSIEPFSSGGYYVNFDSESAADRVQLAYGKEKFARLQALKDQYDPANFFRLNQNIRPSG